MAATIPSSPLDYSSPPESVGTFASQFARTLVEDYAKNELAPDLTSKILFAFLDHLPPDGLCNVCEDIIQTRDNLRELADHYVSNILIPIRASGGKTPSGLTTSRFFDLSDTDTDAIASEITSQKGNQAKLKAQCLARDNNRCVLSGMYDLRMARKLPPAVSQNLAVDNTEIAEVIERILQDRDETACLAADGSTPIRTLLMAF